MSLSLKIRQLCFGILLLVAGGASLSGNTAVAQGRLNLFLPPFEVELQKKIKLLEGLQYEAHSPESILDSESVEFRPIEILVVSSSIDSKEVREFLKALSEEKQTLMRLYSIDNHLYNQFALKAVGILGQESQFFAHYLYQYKANVPDPIVYATKKIVNFFKQEETDSLSKGPTSMKSIPEIAGRYYGITNKEQLEVPFNSAVATIGYLAETYRELLEKKQAYKLDCITDENISDMHLYLYFGGASYRRDLMNCNVHPDQNIYIRHVNYFKHKVQLFEFNPDGAMQ